MAYLNPTKLTCPTCGFSAQIETVVGVGPGSRKGDIAQRYFRDPGPFTEAETEDGRGTLSCPEDGTLVWTNSRTQHAYGPLRAKEMQGVHGRNWLVPGTENPFPPKPIIFSPENPFSGPRPVKPK